MLRRWRAFRALMREDSEEMRAVRVGLLRLALLITVLVCLFVASQVAGIDLSPDWIEDWGDDLGWAGVLAFIPVVVVLNSLFLLAVPIFAGGAGQLFGVPLGTALSILAVAASSATQNAIGRRFGGERAQRVMGTWGKRLDDLLDRRGFRAVLYVRLILLVPYTLLNYASGVTRLRPWVLGAGAAIAMAPRVWAYTALGGNLDDLSSTEGTVAIVLIIASAVLGVTLIVRAALHARTGRPT